MAGIKQRGCPKKGARKSKIIDLLFQKTFVFFRATWQTNESSNHFPW